MPLEKMLSTGIDLVEIHRIRRSMKNPRFCKKILGSEEYMQLEKRGFAPQSVAVSFAAKEAFAKAMGTGVRGFQLRDVELLRNTDGQALFSAASWSFGIGFKRRIINFPSALPILGYMLRWW